VGARITAFAVLLLLGGGCLTSPAEGPLTSGPTSGGGISGGILDSGSSSTTGGDAGPGDAGCADVYCAPGYQCNPVDGVCRCGGQDCEGDCEPDSGTCLVTCPADAGGGPYPLLGTSAYAVRLPAAVVGSNYLYQFEAPCGSSLTWEAVLPPLQWELYFTPAGVLAGLAWQVPDGGPFEFEVEVWDSRGDIGVQNYLLEVVPPDGGS